MAKPVPLELDLTRKFWSCVGDVSDCWLWIGNCTSTGYGRLTIGRRARIAAHRFAFRKWNGPLKDGLVISHICDNKKCVNPKHLTQTTQRENVRDSFRRDLAGKLNFSKADDIRRKYKSGISQPRLATEYGVCQESISNIVTGKTWNRRSFEVESA